MKKSISRWYLIQNIIALVVVVAIHSNMTVTITSGLVLLLSIIFKFDVTSLKQLNKANWFIQFFLQPWALVSAWNAVYMELVQHHLNIWPILTILFIYYVIMFIPFAFVIVAKAKNFFLRIVFTYLQFFVIILLNKFSSNLLLKSNIIRAVSYFVFIVLLMHLWGAAGPDLKSVRTENDWIIAGLVSVTLIFVIVNSSNNLDTIQELIKDISKDKIINFWEALRAGIGEEITFRYGIVVCLLWIFKRSPHKLIFTTLGSSVLFGISHLANLFAGQTLIPTLSQVIFAISVGLLFISIYLYTGKLWLTILFHFAIDWGNTFSTGTRILSSVIKITPQFMFSVVILIIFGAILIWMMHGKRRQVMEEHAKALIGE